MPSESCPTKPTDKRNYRNDGLHRTGKKRDPYTVAVGKGIIRDGVLTETGDTSAQASDAVSSPAPGGAGCVACE